MVGWLVFTVFKALRKDEAERTVMKNKKRPVVVETADTEENPNPKRKVSRTFSSQTPQQDEYFSYETMSDRDFAKEFGHTAEETVAATSTSTSQPAVHLNMDEEEVFKGIVWSEILKRKY